MTEPGAAQYVDPKLDGTSAAIARDMQAAAEASQGAATAPDTADAGAARSVGHQPPDPSH